MAGWFGLQLRLAIEKFVWNDYRENEWEKCFWDQKVGDHCSTPKPPVFIAGMLAYLIPASSRLAVYDLTPQFNDSNGIFNPCRESNS